MREEHRVAREREEEKERFGARVPFFFPYKINSLIKKKNVQNNKRKP